MNRRRGEVLALRAANTALVLTDRALSANRRRVAYVVAAAGALLATVVLANYATGRWPAVPVAPGGLTATAGTFAAGLALGLRDVLHRLGGWPAVLVTLAAGAALSWVLATPQLAVASAVAFGTSELADAALFTRLRRRGWRTAVLASNVVGAVIDTVLFLALAFGWAAVTWPALAGQLLVKAGYATAPFLVRRPR